jgi:hypothetical protein
VTATQTLSGSGTSELSLAETYADVTAPDTAITSGPAAGSSTTDTTPSFGFATQAFEAGATFECSIDGGAFGACSGPGDTHTTAALPLGAHVFAVRAKDNALNADPTPAQRSFSVIAQSSTTPPPKKCKKGRKLKKGKCVKKKRKKKK